MQKPQNGRTALMGAVERGHSKVVRLLLGKGADVAAKDSRCRTALDLAKKERRKKSGEKIEALLRARETKE